MKYTYSDEDEIYSDTTTSRRSTRNTRRNTPEGPTVTQSGRQVKSRQGGAYGESILSGARASVGLTDEADNSESTGGRPRRAAVAAAAAGSTNGRPKGGRHIEGYNNVDEMTSDEEGDASEQDYGDDEEDDPVSLASDVDDQDELTDSEEPEDSAKENGEKKSLLVKLPVKTPTPEKKTFIKLKLSPEKDNTSTQPTKDGPGNLVAEKQSNPIDIAAKSPAPHPAPLSPRSPLAFRGSPEKPPAALPPSIGVGFGGS